MLSRLLTCGVCAAFLATGQSEGAGSTVIPMLVLPDGSLQIEGHRYATSATVNAEIALLEKRRPHPNLRLTADKHVRYEAIAKALTLLQGTGFKIGVVNTQQKIE